MINRPSQANSIRVLVLGPSVELSFYIGNSLFNTQLDTPRLLHTQLIKLPLLLIIVVLLQTEHSTALRVLEQNTDTLKLQILRQVLITGQHEVSQ